MFVTSTLSMSGQQQNAENERQHLLDRLLDAVKQCQVRFGGKTELATDGDSRVVCLLTQFEAVFQHGFKKTRVSAFRQVGQVAGIVKLDSEAVFWSFVKVHLGKLEEERFHSLQKATTNAARGRAWLRSALNEHSLEKSLLHMLGTKPVLSQFYENDAFFMDEERASMLPMIAAGLSPILFALTVDSEELNIVRQQPPSLTINKDVFSNILPSFPHKPVVEPAPVYSAALTDYFSQERRKKKKKKKKRNAAIVSIEDDNQQDFVNDSMEFPLSDASVKETVNSSCDCKRSSLGHSRSSSYPGNIAVGTEGSAVKTSRMNGQDIVFTEITKSISLPDNSVPVESIEEVHQAKGKTTILNLENLPENVCVEPRYDAVGESLQEAPTAEDTGNFVFGAAEFLKRSNAEQKEMLSQNHNNEQRLTGSVITVDAANVIKESNKVKETDLLQLPIVIDSESGNFQTSFSSSVVIQDPKNKQEKLSQKKHNTDFYYPCNLKDDEDKESNYSIVRMETASVVEKTVADHDTKASNESGEPYSVIEQEHQAFRNSRSENTTLQEGIGENEALYENTANDFAEFEPSRSPKSQAAANNGEVEPLLLMDSGEYLVPVAGSDLTSKTVAQSTFYDVPEVSVENDVDSLSSTSWPCVEDPECLSENTYDWPLNTSTRSVAMVSDASAEAALAACSDAQRGMDNMARGGFVTIERTTGDRGINRDSSRSRHDSMSTGELKQALVSMMLRKDDTEQQNRSLQSELGKEREKSQELGTKNEQLQDEIKQQENFNAAKIASLSRENELLKHQLKKYVGAVQALRSDLQGRATETAEVLSGIRQDEILPPLPPEQATEQARLSEEAEEYKRKLIQVADLHGELLEFNERLHKQLSYYQHKVRRLREELVHLRGPLPEDTESLDDVEASLSDFDPAVMSVGTRPLVNVWIPSVFLRGRPSNEHHVYQVYVRIKDDEWNIYRRYSQFFDMHKSLRQKFPVVDTFQFPPKKTLGNKDTRFVEDRRRLLQDYLRRVVNLCVTTDRQLRDNTSKTVLLQIIPFFGEPFPPQKTKNASSRRKRSLKYDGL